MLITDAQVHVWAPDTPDRPWPVPRRSAFTSHGERSSFRADELLAAMDEAGVQRAVLVPPSWEGNRNDLAVAAARENPERLAVMARLGPELLAAGTLGALAREPGVLGLRVTASSPQADLPGGVGDPAAEWLFAETEAAGLPVMVLAPGAHRELDALARRRPGLRLVVDHCNLADRLAGEELGTAVAPLLALAERPNVAVKVSALPCYTGEGPPFASLQPVVRAVLGAFGPRRCLWGSDLTRLPCRYRDWVRFGAQAPFLSPEERRWLMGRSLEEWLGWPGHP